MSRSATAAVSMILTFEGRARRCVKRKDMGIVRYSNQIVEKTSVHLMQIASPLKPLCAHRLVLVHPKYTCTLSKMRSRSHVHLFLPTMRLT
jgi:hypothetical protein